MLLVDPGLKSGGYAHTALFVAQNHRMGKRILRPAIGQFEFNSPRGLKPVPFDPIVPCEVECKQQVSRLGRSSVGEPTSLEMTNLFGSTGGLSRPLPKQYQIGPLPGPVFS